MPATAKPSRCFYLCLAMLLFAGSEAASADPSKEAIAATRAAVSEMTPKDVGSRYGQALGAVEVCTGTKATDKVSQINAIYTGADLQSFTTQATKIREAWNRLKLCAIADNPSQCKVIADESCAAAIAEIGPSGTVLPGLLEQIPH
ncbi:MAG TPA: hypothetical protein VIF13_09610 [Hyphomicrobium sp.]